MVTRALVVTTRPLTLAASIEAIRLLPPTVSKTTSNPNPDVRRLTYVSTFSSSQAYKLDVEAFIAFAGLRGIAELRSITRAHVIAWRKDLEKRELTASSIQRKLSALSALFDYLCEHNAVSGNPVDGVKRPMANGNEGSTPALGDTQARKLLEAPPATRSRACAIAPSSPPCSITASAARSSVG
jgi:integrase